MNNQGTNKQLQQQLLKNQQDYNQQINEYRQQAAISNQNRDASQYNIPYPASQMPQNNQQNFQQNNYNQSYSRQQLPYPNNYQPQVVNYQAFMRYYFSVRDYHKVLVILMTLYQVVSIILGIIIFATLEASCRGYIIYLAVYFVGSLVYLSKLSFAIKNIVNLKNKHISKNSLTGIVGLFILGAIIKVAFVIYTIVIYDVNIGDCYLKSGIQILLAAVALAEITIMSIFMCYFYNNERRIFRCSQKL